MKCKLENIVREVETAELYHIDKAGRPVQFESDSDLFEPTNYYMCNNVYCHADFETLEEALAHVGLKVKQEV